MQQGNLQTILRKTISFFVIPNVLKILSTDNVIHFQLLTSIYPLEDLILKVLSLFNYLSIF